MVKIKKEKVHHYFDIFGSEQWMINGKLHREDGPACISKNGDKRWYIDGKLHRIGAPAIEYVNGSKSWYKHGLKHRKEGPAIEMRNGDYEYWNNGKRHNLIDYAVVKTERWRGRVIKEWWVNNEKIDTWEDVPFYVFAIDYELPLDYNQWSNDMKILFKLTYGGSL